MSDGDVKSHEPRYRCRCGWKTTSRMHLREHCCRYFSTTKRTRPPATTHPTRPPGVRVDRRLGADQCCTKPPHRRASIPGECLIEYRAAPACRLTETSECWGVRGPHRERKPRMLYGLLR